MKPQAGKSGRPDGRLWIFLSRASLFLILAMMLVLAGLICVNSFFALWPGDVDRVRLNDGTSFLGFRMRTETAPGGARRIQYRVANRDRNGGVDFRWVPEEAVLERDCPENAVAVTRTENGDFLGFLKSISFDSLLDDLADSRARWNAEGEPLRRRLAALGDDWQDAHFAALKAGYELEKAGTPEAEARWRERLAAAQAEEQAVKDQSAGLMAGFNEIRAAFDRETVAFVTEEGAETTLPLSKIVDAVQPNALSPAGKVWRFFVNVHAFLAQYPREANTEGGIYPALFGTVMLVFIMAISAFPLGVAAGVYLREYARDGFLSRAARIAVNNLAGVPSIVYGIFGLGFFVYGMGGAVDRLLYPERVAAGINTFGGGGVLWSSLTLGLLTLPVVVVSTEEALATIPSEIRQGSLALGATRFQTLWRVILPMAAPGILTGFILAMARAAGEVAPLMLTGAVKAAHSLPLDGNWPFAHLERKFMHLGFHIYDMGFQSPNVEASKPLVYLTALVLLALVFILNLAAVTLRKRMREKYAMKGF